MGERDSEIRSELAELDTQVLGLYSDLGDLERQLAPVLAEVGPGTTREAGPPRHGLSPVARRIYDLTEQLRDIRQLAYEIVRRLEV